MFLIILCDCKLIGNHVILICVCLFVVDVGSVGLMWLFAQHASIHCRSYIFYTSSIWLLSSVCVCCYIVYCFCSSQGLAWMQKVMVPRSNSFSFNLLFNFFILTRGLVWNRSTFVLLRFSTFTQEINPVDLCECPTSTGCYA